LFESTHAVLCADRTVYRFGLAVRNREETIAASIFEEGWIVEVRGLPVPRGFFVRRDWHATHKQRPPFRSARPVRTTSSDVVAAAECLSGCRHRTVS
jgi:hypothetical protein